MGRCLVIVIVPFSVGLPLISMSRPGFNAQASVSQSSPSNTSQQTRQSHPHLGLRAGFWTDNAAVRWGDMAARESSAQ